MFRCWATATLLGQSPVHRQPSEQHHHILPTALLTMKHISQFAPRSKGLTLQHVRPTERRFPLPSHALSRDSSLCCKPRSAKHIDMLSELLEVSPLLHYDPTLLMPDVFASVLPNPATRRETLDFLRIDLEKLRGVSEIVRTHPGERQQRTNGTTYRRRSNRRWQTLIAITSTFFLRSDYLALGWRVRGRQS